jgi:uroporphyrinogen decarboxylase
MDLSCLKKRYGRRICLFGGVNTETLINGDIQTIREEVRTAINQAGRGGGLVLTCSNVVPRGASLENYMIMRQAVMDYGKYPIKEFSSY